MSEFGSLSETDAPYLPVRGLAETNQIRSDLTARVKAENWLPDKGVQNPIPNKGDLKMSYSKKFAEESAASLMRLAAEAAKGIKLAKGGNTALREPADARAHLKAHTSRLSTFYFQQQLEVEMLLLASLAGECGKKVLAMTLAEMQTWAKSPAAAELMKAADERRAVYQALAAFETTDRKVFIGGHRGIPVYIVVWFGYPDETTDAENEDKEVLMKIAALYIDAAISLEPGFRATGFNAGYGQNNLPYLLRELEETKTLYRVFTPFDAPEDEEGGVITDAKETAKYRCLLIPSGEGNSPTSTPELETLVEYARAIVRA